MIFKQQNKIQPHFSPAAMGSLVLLLFVFIIGIPYTLDDSNKSIVRINNSYRCFFDYKRLFYIQITKEGIVYINRKQTSMGHLPFEIQKVLNEVEDPVFEINADDSVTYKKFMAVLTTISEKKHQTILLSPPE